MNLQLAFYFVSGSSNPEWCVVILLVSLESQLVSYSLRCNLKSWVVLDSYGWAPAKVSCLALGLGGCNL